MGQRLLEHGAHQHILPEFSVQLLANKTSVTSECFQYQCSSKTFAHQFSLCLHRAPQCDFKYQSKSFYSWKVELHSVQSSQEQFVQPRQETTSSPSPQNWYWSCLILDI